MANRVLFAFCLVASVLTSNLAKAIGSKAGGGWSFGANLGIANVDQADMNTLVKNANSRASGISTSELGSGWDFSGYIGYRFNDTVEFQFRPSYFWQSEEGSGTGGDFNYAVSTLTLAPTFRFYLLEDDTIKFFGNLGIIFGLANGSIEEGSNKVEFSGQDMGYLAGLGAEFCFYGSSHCLSVEGNFRILEIARVKADSSSGDFTSGSPSPPSLTQGTKGEEVELGGDDLSISMTGIIGAIGYVYHY